MALAVQQIYPVAHLPLVLGVLRRLEVATVIDGLMPPHPAHVVSCGRGVEAWVLAILDGEHARYKVGQRREERGMIALLQPDCTRAALPDDRLGHLLDTLFAAHLNRLFGAIALKALAVYAIPTPWLQQDTTPLALSGAYADEPQTPGAPRPAYGPSKDGRDALKQVLLSLGVSGDGGIPLRVGLRDGHRRDRVATPGAIEEWLALGLEGVRGIVADRQASRRRPLGVCLEHKIDRGPRGPRTCAVRQALAAWGGAQPTRPLLVEQPGRPQHEAPRRWHGHRGRRQVEVEDSAGRGALETLRLVGGHSSPLAPQQTQASTAAQEQEAEAITAHLQHVQARWFACEADAEAAVTE